jgi:hypothetical protein
MMAGILMSLALPDLGIDGRCAFASAVAFATGGDGMGAAWFDCWCGQWGSLAGYPVAWGLPWSDPDNKGAYRYLANY